MDERKNNMLKQNKKREKQKKTHASELENIHKYVEEVRSLILVIFKNNFKNKTYYLLLKVVFLITFGRSFLHIQTVEMYNQAEVEMKLAGKQEAYV